MTKEELYNGILGIKSETLLNNRKYFNSLRIGSRTTYNRQREVLIALDIYIQILDYYYDSYDNGVNPITEEEIEIIVAECTKLLRTFKDTYNER